ncbi:MAG: hypothetical protein J5441_03125 [Clostridia bacterium]|nr:hypothetical protein [Clostridia bacterium]
MTKKQKSAKKSFISSVLVLCLCFTMFVGTTFAWYNDSVTSGRNTIVAGSLELSIEYYDGQVGDTSFTEANWKPVNASVALFDDNAKFEPGAVQVAYIRIKNGGDLAFKYGVSVVVDNEVIGKTKDNADVKLSDYLKFGKATVSAPYTSRENAITAVGTGASLVNSAEVVATNSILRPTDDPVVLALVIYMPSSVGNEANPDPNHKPSITFGLNALASQATIESDSFSNTYDSTATMPAVASVTVPANGNATTITAGDITVALPANAGATDNVYELDVSNANTETDPTSGETSVAFDASLYLNNVKVSGSSTLYEMTMNIGPDATISSVTHNGVALTEGTGDQQYQYDPTNGDLTIYTKSFSPFEISYKVITRVANAGELAAALAAKKNYILLTADITGDRFTVISDTVIDGNGHKITDTNTSGRAIWIDDTGVTLTLKNLTIDGANKCQRGVQVNVLDSGEWNYATIIIDNCDIVNMTYYAVNLCTKTTVNLTVTDTTISGWSAINAYGTGNVITVKDSELIGINDKGYNAEGWNNFATICLEGDTTGETTLHSADYTISIENTTIRASQTTGNKQALLGFNNNAENSSVAFKNCTFDIGNGCHFGYDKGTGNSLSIDGDSINMPSGGYFDITTGSGEGAQGNPGLDD